MGLVYSENVVNLYLMVSGLSSVLPEVFDLSINLASMALWSQWKYSKNYNSHTPFIFFSQASIFSLDLGNPSNINTPVLNSRLAFTMSTNKSEETSFPAS